MSLETTRFGVIDLTDDSIIAIPEGVPGFPEMRRITLLEVEEGRSLYWIQDADDGDVAFLAVVPWDFFPDYNLLLNDEDEVALKIDDPGDVLVLNLVTIDREAGEMSANLLGPLVINQKANVARQVVLAEDLPTKASLGAIE